MAKITRVFQKLFGASGDSGDFGKFGSLAVGSIEFSKDPVLIQSLAPFDTGWADAVVTGNVPALEDMNSLFLLAFRQIAYNFQAGIPEWDDETTYYIGSLCQIGGVIFQSLTDDNINFDPLSEPTKWGYGGGILPTGSIITFVSKTPPSGYLYCDGSSVLRASYPRLYAVIGNSFGTADGTHFNTPDLRGKFVRGMADGQTTDPDRAARTAQATGGNTGDNIGSIQADELESHSHKVDAFYDARVNMIDSITGGWGSNASINSSYPASSSIHSSDITGGNETRPINVNLAYHIKI